MKYLLIITAIVCALAGCRVSRHTVKSNTATSDTVRIATHDTQYIERIKDVLIYKRDTIIMAPARRITDTFSITDLLPFIDAAGNKRGNSYTKRNGYLSSTVTTDIAGNVYVDCNQDSMILAITTLTDSIVFIRDSLNKAAASTVKSSHISSAEYTETLVKVKSWLAGNWWWLVPVVLFVIMLEVISRLRKSKIGLYGIDKDTKESS